MTKAIRVRTISRGYKGDQITVYGIDRNGRPTIVTRHERNGRVNNPDERAPYFRNLVTNALSVARAEEEHAKASLENVGKKLLGLKGSRKKTDVTERKRLRDLLPGLQTRVANAEVGLRNAQIQHDEVMEQLPQFVPVTTIRNIVHMTSTATSAVA